MVLKMLLYGALSGTLCILRVLSYFFTTRELYLLRFMSCYVNFALRKLFRHRAPITRVLNWGNDEESSDRQDYVEQCVFRRRRRPFLIG